MLRGEPRGAQRPVLLLRVLQDQQRQPVLEWRDTIADAERSRLQAARTIRQSLARDLSLFRCIRHAKVKSALLAGYTLTWPTLPDIHREERDAAAIKAAQPLPRADTATANAIAAWRVMEPTLILPWLIDRRAAALWDRNAERDFGD